MSPEAGRSHTEIPRRPEAGVPTSRSPERVLFAVVAFHAALWTVLPWSLRHQLPLDALESTVWGRQLQWGYDKNPWLNGALVWLALRAVGRHDLVFYVLAQLCVAATLFLVWRVAGRALGRREGAAAAAIALLGNPDMHVDTVDWGLNDNVLSMPLWALMVLIHARARALGGPAEGVLFGLVTGIATMTKYTAVFLLPALWLGAGPGCRTRKARFLLPALLVSLAVVAPHLAWLETHAWQTARYAVARLDLGSAGLVERLLRPIAFAGGVVAGTAGVLVLLAWSFPALRPWARRGEPEPEQAARSTNVRYFTAVLLVPLGLMVLVSLATGARLRVPWAQPMSAFLPLVLLLRLPGAPDPHGLPKLAVLAAGTTFLVGAGYTVSMLTAGTSSRANYPGPEIARALEAEWETRHGAPLRFVAGERSIAAPVAYYARAWPVVYLDLDPRHSAWVDEGELRRAGALFVWKPGGGPPTLEPQLRARFSRLEGPWVREFTWHRAHGAPARVAFAILPPIDALSGRSR